MKTNFELAVAAILAGEYMGTPVSPTIGKRVVNSELSVIKSVSGALASKLVRPSDTQADGFCDINNARLEKGEIMLVRGIQLLSGVGAGTTDANGLATEFSMLETKIVNGYMELKQGNNMLISRFNLGSFRTHYAKFDATATSSYAYAYGNGRIGYVEFDYPILLTSQDIIELNLYWGTAAATNTFIKATLVGVKFAK